MKRQKTKREAEEEPRHLAPIQQAAMETLCNAMTFLTLTDAPRFMQTCSQMHQRHRQLTSRRQHLDLDMSLRSMSNLSYSKKAFQDNILSTAPALRSIQVFTELRGIFDASDWIKLIQTSTKLQRVQFSHGWDLYDYKSNGDHARGHLSMLEAIGTHGASTLDHVEISGLGGLCYWNGNLSAANEWKLPNLDWNTAFQTKWAYLQVLSIETYQGLYFDQGVTAPFVGIFSPTDLKPILAQLKQIQILRLPLRILRHSTDTLRQFIDVGGMPTLQKLDLDCWRVNDANDVELAVIQDETDEKTRVDFFQDWATMLSACPRLTEMIVRLVDSMEFDPLVVNLTRTKNTDEQEHEANKGLEMEGLDTSKESKDTKETKLVEQRGTILIQDMCPFDETYRAFQLHLDLVRFSGIRSWDNIWIQTARNGPSLVATVPNLDWKDVATDIRKLECQGNLALVTPTWSAGLAFLVDKFPSLENVAETNTEAQGRNQTVSFKGKEFHSSGLSIGELLLMDVKDAVWSQQRRSMTQHVSSLELVDIQNEESVSDRLGQLLATKFRGLEVFSLLTFADEPMFKSQSRFEQALASLDESSPRLQRFHLETRLKPKLTKVLWSWLATKKHLNHVFLELHGVQQYVRAEDVLKLRNLQTLKLGIWDDYEDEANDGNSLDGSTFFGHLARMNPNLTDLQLYCRFRNLRRLPMDLKLPNLETLNVSWTNVWSVDEASVSQFLHQHPKLRQLRLNSETGVEDTGDKEEDSGFVDLAPCSLSYETAIRASDVWKTRTILLPFTAPLLRAPWYRVHEDLETKLPWMGYKPTDVELHGIEPSFASELFSLFAKRFGAEYNSYKQVIEIGQHWKIATGFASGLVLYHIPDLKSAITKEWMPEFSNPFSKFQVSTVALGHQAQRVLDGFYPELNEAQWINGNDYLHPNMFCGPCSSNDLIDVCPWSDAHAVRKLSALLYIAIRLLLPDLPRDIITHWMELGNVQAPESMYKTRYQEFAYYLVYNKDVLQAQQPTAILRLESKKSTAGGGRNSGDGKKEDDGEEARQRLLESWHADLGTSDAVRLTEQISQCRRHPNPLDDAKTSWSLVLSNTRDVDRIEYFGSRRELRVLGSQKMEAAKQVQVHNALRMLLIQVANRGDVAISWIHMH